MTDRQKEGRKEGSTPYIHTTEILIEGFALLLLFQTQDYCSTALPYVSPPIACACRVKRERKAMEERNDHWPFANTLCILRSTSLSLKTIDGVL